VILKKGWKHFGLPKLDGGKVRGKKTLHAKTLGAHRETRLWKAPGRPQTYFRKKPRDLLNPKIRKGFERKAMESRKNSPGHLLRKEIDTEEFWGLLMVRTVVTVKMPVKTVNEGWKEITEKRPTFVGK